MTEGSALKGLAAYRARKEEQDRREAERNRPKIQRFALEKDGDSAIVRFAQEIDPDAKHYDESLGMGFVNIEHVNPDRTNGWKNRGNCTLTSQGACYPDELVQDKTVDWNDRKGWKQKEKFYINVIAGEPREVIEKKGKYENVRTYGTDIDQATGDGVVYLLEQGTYNGIYDTLAEMATDDETITDHYYKIKRKGNEYNDTSYLITKLKEIPADAKPLSEFELINFEEDVMNEVPYAQQEAFYWRGVERADAPLVEEEREPVGAGSSAPGPGVW